MASQMKNGISASAMNPFAIENMGNECNTVEESCITTLYAAPCIVSEITLVNLSCMRSMY